MDKKRSVSTEIFVSILLLIGAFVGVPSFFLGLCWALADVVSVSIGGGGNLTGLGIAIGFPMALVGAIFLTGFILAARFEIKTLYDTEKAATLLPKATKIFFAFIMVVVAVALVFAIQGSVAWKSKITKEFQKEEKAARARDKEILTVLKNNEYATIMVVCHIRHQDIEAQNLEAQKEFAVKNIIQPLGEENIRNYTFHNWGSLDVYFTADVTKAGYESLKQSKYLQAIYLKESFGKE